MSQTPEELSDQAARRRAELRADLDALQQKVSPSAVVGRRTRAARERLGGAREKVMGTASRTADAVPAPGEVAGNAAQGARDVAGTGVRRAQQQVEGSPLAAGLVAFGAGLVAASLLPATRREAHAGAAALDAVQQQAQPVLEEAKQAAGEVGEQLRDHAAHAVQEVASSGAEAGEQLRAEAGDAAGSVRDQAREATPGTTA